MFIGDDLGGKHSFSTPGARKVNLEKGDVFGATPSTSATRKKHGKEGQVWDHALAHPLD